MTTENPSRLGAAAPAKAAKARVQSGPGMLFTPGLGLFNFGSYMAILTPVMLTLPLKVQTLVGSQHEAGAFGLVTAIGAIFAIICNPLGGRLSDRTTAPLGMPRPWVI